MHLTLHTPSDDDAGTLPRYLTQSDKPHPSRGGCRASQQGVASGRGGALTAGGVLGPAAVYALPMKVTVKYVLAFGDRRGTGNPAGVVLEGGALSEAQCLSIAAEVGASETAFLSVDSPGSIAVRFFTPLKKIPFCGHATIAAFSVARDTGMLPEGSHLINRGPREFSVEISGSQVFMRQQEYQEFVLDSSAVEEIRGEVFRSGLGESLAMVIGYTGVRFLLIHLPAESLLPEVEVSQEALYRFSEKHDLVGMYAFAEKEGRRAPRGTSGSAQGAGRSGGGPAGEGSNNEGPSERVSGPVISARMFAPYYGIEEESATGMAAGPAAHYLVNRHYLQATRFTIEQGRYMPQPSPSIIHAWFHRGDSRGRVRIGGGAYLESERSVSV